MAKATLDKNGIAIKAGELTAYNLDGVTREYLSASTEYLALGVGLPANSCIDAPVNNKDGFAVCRTRDNNEWEYIVDHRGKPIYDTSTGQPSLMAFLGEYPEHVTTIAPSTPYDVWNGSEWVTDEDAQKNAQMLEADKQKSALLAEAQSTISLWQTELQLGIISDDDKASLIAWMKYIQALNAVDVSTAPDIEWPVKPE